MKKIAIICMALSGSLFAQGEINGRLMDKELNEPIIGASVWVEYGGSKIGAATDYNGKYTIKPVPEGTYVLTCTMIGKDTIKVPGVKVISDKICFVKPMEMQDFTMVTLIIRPGDELINPEEPSKRTLDATQISQIAGAGRSGNTLLASASDGAVHTSGEGQVYFRGSRAGTFVSFLDGVKITTGIPNVPSSALKSYTVYTGGLPAKYGDTMGGVVVIETKNYFDLYNQRVAQKGIKYN